MSSLDEIKEERLRKRDQLISAGMNPYAAHTNRTHAIVTVLSDFEELSDEETEVVVAGRVMSLRRHGGSAFADLFDGSAKMQVFFSRDALGMRLFDLLNDTIDGGDFIEVKGVPFVTKRGAEAIAVSDWQVLTKAITNIPTEHFGIKDDDERYRNRHLDILLDPELQKIFHLKSKYWQASRAYLEQAGFMEVHTPTLETTTGGAEANPFKTHHDDFDIDVFLRISVGELWQKRLMAAGFPRVYEMGRVYRNEGTSPDHLQEFSNIEFYAAYMNFDEGLTFLENHIKYVLDEAFAGQRVFSIKGHEVDFDKPFERIDYVSTIKEQTGIDVTKANEVEMAATARELGIEFDGNNRERLMDTLWKYCRKQIAGPVWLTGHPKLVSPLSKENDAQPGTVLRAQLIMAGAEFNNCFAELNDPAEQADRFKVQADLLAAGDNEAMMPDWEFVEMLEHGMPPTFGAATLGERFFAYLVDKPIRETQLFPLMKPKTTGGGKKKEVQVATIVLANDADLEPWQVLNATAHLSAELGVQGGSALQKFPSITTADAVTIPINIQHAIIIKQAPKAALLTLQQQAVQDGLMTGAFTAEMLATTNDNKIKTETAEILSQDLSLLGVMLFGPRSQVEQLTNEYSLYS